MFKDIRIRTMENTKKDELKKKLEKVRSLQKRAMDNYDSRERNLVEQIREIELEELKSKLGNKYYGRIVHVVVSYDNGDDVRHYIGRIDPDCVSNDGFSFAIGRLTLIKTNKNGDVTEAFTTRCEYKEIWKLGRIDTYRLFEDGEWESNDMYEYRTASIRLASIEEDGMFIRSAFDKIRDDKVSEMDATRDSVLEEIKMYCKK